MRMAPLRSHSCTECHRCSQMLTTKRRVPTKRLKTSQQVVRTRLSSAQLRPFKTSINRGNAKVTQTRTPNSADQQEVRLVALTTPSQAHSNLRTSPLSKSSQRLSLRLPKEASSQVLAVQAKTRMFPRRLTPTPRSSSTTRRVSRTRSLNGSSTSSKTKIGKP